ncbi:MAG TPA: dihydrodipicolinate reductase [bacterium]|nr:dihydrodipicolinate reductase [bacterium]
MAIRVAHYGLGPIGVGILRQVASRKGFKVVGGIDIDPAKVGKDLGAIAGLDRRLGVRVMDDPVAAIRKTKPDVVMLCTRSSLRAAMPQIETVLRLRVPIVSTTEELAYPYRTNRPLARKIDALAKKAKVAIIGTGVNPGFVMDSLPIMLSGVCERVDAVRVDRVQDAGIRRLPFQQKIGAGLAVAEFEERVAAGTVRHVGLTESITMIADAFGWKLGEITDAIRPKVTESQVASDYLTVHAGEVCGLEQDGVGRLADGSPVITLHMEAYLGAPESYDAVTITGHPTLTSRVQGGFHGDVVTASIAVNTIPKVLAAPPGLRTMRDMPLPSFFSGR